MDRAFQKTRDLLSTVFGRWYSFSSWWSPLDRRLPNNDSKQVFLVPSLLPSGKEATFYDYAFSATGTRTLPSPEAVRKAAGPRALGYSPQPVKFLDLNLVVKYGSRITIAEGQCLWAIGKFCPTVPVPKVYGWCQDDAEGYMETFIYMELVEGVTLEDAWPDLEVEEKYEVCSQLSMILQDLRELKQDPDNQFIGWYFLSVSVVTYS